MDNEKDKCATITPGTGDTVNTGYRRTWSKPIIKHIEIKRTMAGSGSPIDGARTGPTSV